MIGASKEDDLKSLLARSGTANPGTPSPGDIQLVAESLEPSVPRSERSLAFLCLSKWAPPAPTTTTPNEALASAVSPYLSATFEKDDPESYVPLVALLTGLFSLVPATAQELLTTKVSSAASSQSESEGSNGAQVRADVLDLLLESAELRSGLQVPFAEMLGQAASTKPGRQLVQRAEEWLRGAVDFAGDTDLGTLCAVALSKLTGAEVAPDGQPDLEDKSPDAAMVEQVSLCRKMMDHVIASPSISKSAPSSALLSTLEGLGIMSTKGYIKHVLATTAPFLSALIALSPVPDPRPGSLPSKNAATAVADDAKLFEPVETSLCYGLATIFTNITAFKPTLSAEDEQIARLRAMAISGKKGAQVQEDPFETEEAIRTRVDAVIKAGVVGALRGLVRAESPIVKETLGRLCLNLVSDKSHRAIFVRDGGFRVLNSLLRDLVPYTPTSASATASQEDQASPTRDYLPSTQALAKLAITTPPHLLFPPPSATTCLNALSPLYYLLCTPSSTLLQSFEALMALTNLASIDPSIADRIVGASVPIGSTDTMWRGAGRSDDKEIKVITKVEEFLLDSNTLVRRAATELVCNLVSSSAGHAHFAGGTGDVAPRVQSRLNVLVVLSTVDDLPTRLAAGGALALVTEDPAACANLLSVKDETHKRSIWTRLLSLLSADVPEIDEDGEEMQVISSSQPNVDLCLRGACVLYNLIGHVADLQGEQKKAEVGEVGRSGVEEKLMGVLRSMKSQDVLGPVVESLKLLKGFKA